MPFALGENLDGSYTYIDADGDLEGVSTFQWYRADDGVGTNEEANGYKRQNKRTQRKGKH